MRSEDKRHIAPSAEMLIERFVRDAMSRVRPRAHKLDQGRLGPIGGVALISLLDQAPLPMQVIATNLQRDKSQVTKIVRVLERNHLVVTSGMPIDKRVKLVKLTNKGRKTARQLLEAWRDVASEILAPLDEDQVQQFLELLGGLYADSI